MGTYVGVINIDTMDVSLHARSIKHLLSPMNRIAGRNWLWDYC